MGWFSCLFCGNYFEVRNQIKQGGGGIVVYSEDSDDEFAYSEAHDEEHIEWYGEATYDDYFDWE